MRAGMMKGTGAPALPRASRTRPQGCVKVRVKLRSSTSAKVAPLAIIRWPRLSFTLQRFRDEITSLEVTGVPSLNFSPSRRVKL
ncbi:hypothetical protein D3C87_1998970 [compost metagenome]